MNKHILIDLKKCKKQKKYILDIDEEKVKLLSYICRVTGAKVVLSSSWRSDWKNGKENLKLKPSILLQELFDKYDIDIIGITPQIPRSNDIDEKYHSWRENEIKDYLSKHREIESFCVIDDEEFDLQTLKDYLVKTKFRDVKNNMGGLNEGHVKQAIKILKKL